MILNHINHSMPIYKDCTLVELIVVSGTYLVFGGLIFSFFTWIIFGYVSVGSALTLLTLVHVTRFLLGQLQKLKYGKPYGYYHQLLLKKLHKYPLINFLWQSPYVTRQGRWSVRRTLP